MNDSRAIHSRLMGFESGSSALPALGLQQVRSITALGDGHDGVEMFVIAEMLSIQRGSKILVRAKVGGVLATIGEHESADRASVDDRREDVRA